MCLCVIPCREGGDLGLFITLVPKVITFSYSFLYQLWGLIFNFDWLVNKVEYPNFTTINCNLKRGNFLFLHWGYISTYRPLSYPFRSLQIFKYFLNGLRGHYNVEYENPQRYFLQFFTKKLLVYIKS